MDSSIYFYVFITKHLVRLFLKMIFNFYFVYESLGTWEPDIHRRWKLLATETPLQPLVFEAPSS